MPRVKLGRQPMPVADFIKGKMGRRTQGEVARAIGISQQVLSRKLLTNRLTAEDIHNLIIELDFTDSEIVYAMRECR